jgi:hypothetical protein
LRGAARRDEKNFSRDEKIFRIATLRIIAIDRVRDIVRAVVAPSRRVIACGRRPRDVLQWMTGANDDRRRDRFTGMLARAPVAVAMIGGVDSSLAAAVLVRAARASSACTCDAPRRRERVLLPRDDAADARAVAERLDAFPRLRPARANSARRR